MKYVIIYTLNDDAEEVESARCVLTGGVVSCSGDAAILSNLDTSGISSEKEGKRFFPKDGAAFLEALPKYLNATYIFASKVIEEPD